MNHLFPVNGDLEGAYMKQISLFFALFILCLCPFGCDEGMIDPMQLVDIVSQYETTVQTELPDEVLAAMKLKADEMSKIVHSRIHVEQHITELTTPEDVQYYQELRQWLIDNGYDKIDYFHELQKSYYTRYIDAAGIAIVGPTHLRAKDLIDARDAIVVMTSKHPELRERLLSKHGTFYMVLIPNSRDQIDMPERKLNTDLTNDDPSDDFRGVFGACLTRYGSGTPYKYGLCWAVVGRDTSSARTLVHELAHALDSEMERLQPGFLDKRSEYYKGTGFSSYESWARTVEAWFYQKKPDGYEGFIEEKVAGELLDYWFPRVLLQNESRGYVSVLDKLDDIRKQAKTILEENCFECHGENGTHKDVLLMDNQLELWDLGIIHPGNSDASILFRRILGHPAYGPQMPLGKPPLSEEEIDIIEIWLDIFTGKVRFPSGDIFSF